MGGYWSGNDAVGMLRALVFRGPVRLDWLQEVVVWIGGRYGSDQAAIGETAGRRRSRDQRMKRKKKTKKTEKIKEAREDHRW